jgi:hypothetical protein
MPLDRELSPLALNPVIAGHHSVHGHASHRYAVLLDVLVPLLGRGLLEAVEDVPW